MKRRSGSFELRLRKWYERWVLPHIPRPLHQQRLKLAYFAWGYWPLLRLPGVTLRDRMKLIGRFLRIDWNVWHAHRPCEIACVARVLVGRSARPGEVMVEAGCWNGGSTAKFSLLCQLRGYRLHIYDSFEGVEPLTPEELQRGYDFSGQFAAPEATLRVNLQRFGAPEVCAIHKGWYAETLARNPLSAPVRVVFIDCDSAKGTHEVLQGVLPGLSRDGIIFSQDFHIASVRELLRDQSTWQPYNHGEPEITRLCGHLAALRFPQHVERRQLPDRRQGPERSGAPRRVATASAERAS